MSSIAYISNDFTVTVLTTPAVSPEFRVHSLYLTFEVTGIKCCYENFHSNAQMLYEFITELDISVTCCLTDYETVAVNKDMC